MPWVSPESWGGSGPRSEKAVRHQASQNVNVGPQVGGWQKCRDGREGSSASSETTPGCGAEALQQRGKQELAAPRPGSGDPCGAGPAVSTFTPGDADIGLGPLEQSLGRGWGGGQLQTRSPRHPLDWEAQLPVRCPRAGVGLSLFLPPHPCYPPSPQVTPLPCPPPGPPRPAAQQEGCTGFCQGRGPRLAHAGSLVRGLGWGGQAGRGVAGMGGRWQRRSVWLTTPPPPPQGAPRTAGGRPPLGVSPFPVLPSVSPPLQHCHLGCPPQAALCRRSREGP